MPMNYRCLLARRIICACFPLLTIAEPLAARLAISECCRVLLVLIVYLNGLSNPLQLSWGQLQRLEFPNLLKKLMAMYTSTA